jgi:hypothetical protein
VLWELRVEWMGRMEMGGGLRGMKRRDYEASFGRGSHCVAFFARAFLSVRWSFGLLVVMAVCVLSAMVVCLLCFS